MKTINYIILRGELDRAAGGAGRIDGPHARSRILRDGEDKVIDLAAWKAENLAVPEGPEAGGRRAGAPEPYGEGGPDRRRRRRSEAARDRAELAATLMVAATLAALVLRVLLF